MSRLIDADALLEYYKRLSNECFSANNHEYSILYDCVCAKIAEQPTAYNVDKVVEELDGGAYTTTDTVCGGLFEAIRLSSAIGIVKKGGVEHV